MAKRESTKYPGVYERKVTSRNGDEDTAFDIAYRHEGKLVWENVGRKNDGVNATYASRVRGERLTKIKNNDFIAPGDTLTFRQAADRFMTVHMVGKSSAVHTQSYLNNHVLPAIGDMKMDKIRPLHVEKIKNHAISKGYAPQTIKHMLACIRNIYRKALSWGVYAGSIPTDGVEMPRVDAGRLRFLNEAEAKMLLDDLAERSPQWHDIAYVSLYTGMRLGEILALKVGHLNVQAGIINVMDAKAGTRAAYMTPQVKTILAAHGMQKSPDAYVFEQADGGKINYISSVFARTADRLFNFGITDARYKVVFHTLRHTFGSWLAQRGVPLYTIAELMGHSTLEMTKRYSKLSPDTKRDALAMLPTLTASPAGGDD